MADRSLVSDEAIVAWIDSLGDRPQWQWVFGMLATYGLRPHEAFHLEGPPDEDALVTVLPDTKTGFHVSHPAPEEWIDRWTLRQMRLPAIRSDRANNLVGQAVSTQCSRLAPYDLRHCWARRGVPGPLRNGPSPPLPTLDHQDGAEDQGQGTEAAAAGGQRIGLTVRAAGGVTVLAGASAAVLLLRRPSAGAPQRWGHATAPVPYPPWG